MKRIPVLLTLLALLCVPGVAFSGHDDIDQHRFCIDCGMDRKAYGFSRMLIRFEDGGSLGVCSLHCAVIALAAQSGRQIRSLLVADRNGRDLIDATEAFWVMGGDKSGVMTPVPKWAFRSKTAAEKFIQAHGGEPTPWAGVLEAARQELLKKPR